MNFMLVSMEEGCFECVAPFDRCDMDAPSDPRFYTSNVFAYVDTHVQEGIPRRFLRKKSDRRNFHFLFSVGDKEVLNLLTSKKCYLRWARMGKHLLVTVFSHEPHRFSRGFLWVRNKMTNYEDVFQHLFRSNGSCLVERSVDVTWKREKEDHVRTARILLLYKLLVPSYKTFWVL